MEQILCSLLGVLLIAAFARPTKALRCYECNSVISGGCSDPFDTAKVEDDCGQCSKFVGKKGSLEVVLRGCEQGVVADNGCASQTKDGASGELCLCQTDRCNAASAPVAYIPIMLVAFALAAKKTFMY